MPCKQTTTFPLSVKTHYGMITTLRGGGGGGRGEACLPSDAFVCTVQYSPRFNIHPAELVLVRWLLFRTHLSVWQHLEEAGKKKPGSVIKKHVNLSEVSSSGYVRVTQTS